MKKIFYSISVLAIVLVSLFALNASAQNIGSLKSVVSSGFSFTMDLSPGYTDQDVLELQRVLNADIDTIISLDGEGSRGRETKYFGEKTKQAVVKFQEKYRDTILTPAGLTSGNGIVGKSTRTKLNLLIGVMTTNDSVGSPESRGTNNTNTTNTSNNNTVYTYIAPPATNIITTSVCSFVDLLINIDVINSSLASKARSAVGCSSVANNTNQNGFVEMEANGKSGTLTISSPKNVTISWNSNGTSCVSPDSGNSKSTSGSQTINVTKSTTYRIECRGPFGTVSDSVRVVVDGDEEDEDDNSSYNLTCSADQNSVVVNSPIKWTAKITGSTPSSLTYAWSGTDGLSGSSDSVSRTYSTTGSKSATITTKSGVITKSATCTALILTQSNYNSAVSGFTSTTTNKVLKTNGNSGDMVSIKKSSSIDLKNKMTLEAWINPTEWALADEGERADNVIISKGELDGNIDYALSVDNGKLVFSNEKSSIYTCSSVISLNTWSHVAVTVDESSAQVKLYVNGSEVSNTCKGLYGGTFSNSSAITENTSSSKTSSTSTVNRGNVHIGNFFNISCTEESVNGFIGSIDDVRIWNVARNANDIATSTNKLIASTSTGLVAQYTFDNYLVEDVSSNTNDGFQKGSVTLIEDKTSPAAVPVTSSSLYNYSSYSSTSYIDPDGYCEYPTPEVPEVAEATPPERYFEFAGVVQSVEACQNSGSMKLWKVEIKSCQQGATVSVQRLTGIPSYEPGYIVIRDGYQKVPAVGDSVLGLSVNDMALQCGGGSRYIGTVTGALGASSNKSCAQAAQEVAKQKQEEEGWFDITGAIVGGAIGGIPGAIVGGAVNTIKKVFDW